MEEVQKKLQSIVITEVNSNHIVDHSNSIKTANKENCETNLENGIEELQNGRTSSPPHQSSSDNEALTELSEINEMIEFNKFATIRDELYASCSQSCQEVETIETKRGDELFKITYKQYESELELPSIMKLIQKDLSEPYSIYTYRYFIHNWPSLCFLALHENKCVGCIVCKLDIHRGSIKRGYIAMLAVDKDYRKLKIGTTLVQKAIRVMISNQADEVVLETEITNEPALKLYENLGFVRDKRLFHYYLNGVDALRLKLWFR